MIYSSFPYIFLSACYKKDTVPSARDTEKNKTTSVVMEIPARALIPSCMRNGPGVILILGIGEGGTTGKNCSILEVEDKNKVCKQTVIK